MEYRPSADFHENFLGCFFKQVRRGRLVLLSTSPEQAEKMRKALVCELIVSNVRVNRVHMCTDLV